MSGEGGHKLHQQQEQVLDHHELSEDKRKVDIFAATFQKLSMALFDLGKRTSVHKHSVQAPTSEPVQVSILLSSTNLLLARREGGLHYALGSIHTQSPPSITSAKIIQLNILPPTKWMV